MKFKFVKNVEGKVPAYGGHTVATGDVIELTGSFAAKAEKGTDFEAVESKTKVTVEPVAPTKYEESEAEG